MFPFSLDEIDEALVGGVDGGEGAEVVHDGAEDEGRADGDEVEGGGFGLDEFPCGSLRERFRHAVGGAFVGAQAVLVGERVPVVFGEDLVGVLEPFGGYDGDEGAGDDYALHAWGEIFDRFQDRCRSCDGRVQELGLGVGPVEMERGGGCDGDQN